MQKPTNALERLKTGNARYVAGSRATPVTDRAQREGLVEGQSPYAIVLSCADSRVIPELVFDTGLGELFVVRVAGNVANTSTLATIEYAVAHLGTRLIVVMGHEGCGAVQAAINSGPGADNGHNLNHLLMHLTPAIAAVPHASVEAVVRKNAELTAGELTNRSSILREAVAGEQLDVVAAYYELGSGKVSFAC
jgi:carbonic anhydrase